MKKAVLISIKPEWCDKIISGRKTIELRKSIPKLTPPFKCYIYCTLPKYPHEDFFTVNAGKEDAFTFYGGGKVIGEFVCDSILQSCEMANADLAEAVSCVCREAIYEYSGYGKKQVYGWHISNLRVYDTPIDLNTINLACAKPNGICNANCPHLLSKECDILRGGIRPIKRPPQSWCYVEEQ